MLQIRSQAGESKAGCMLWVAAALLFGLLLSKVAPVKMAVLELEDYMEELAMTKPNGSQHFFEQAIHKKSKELDLTIDKKKIKVRKYPERVVMEVEFTETIEILGTSFDWPISIEIDRDIFII